jgi:hypothetical protein
MALKNRQHPNSTFDRLVRAATLYHREAKKCLRGKAYLAAVVVQVAALEAGLQAMCSMYGKDVKKTSVYQKKKTLEVAGNFQPNSFTAITASVRLVTFSALRIAVT